MNRAHQSYCRKPEGKDARETNGVQQGTIPAETFPDLRAITADEYARRLDNDLPSTVEEWSEWGGPPDTHFKLHVLRWPDGRGVAVKLGYEAARFRKPLGFFAFGCDHQYRELTQDECRAEGVYHAGRCWHVHRCTKCGHTYGVDSSD